LKRWGGATEIAQHAYPTSTRSTGCCAIWDCISSSSRRTGRRRRFSLRCLPITLCRRGGGGGAVGGAVGLQRAAELLKLGLVALEDGELVSSLLGAQRQSHHLGVARLHPLRKHQVLLLQPASTQRRAHGPRVRVWLGGTPQACAQTTRSAGIEASTANALDLGLGHLVQSFPVLPERVVALLQALLENLELAPVSRELVAELSLRDLGTGTSGGLTLSEEQPIATWRCGIIRFSTLSKRL